MKNHLEITKNHGFSSKGCFSWKKKPPAGLHHTDHRAGDAPKPIQNGNAQIDFKFISNLFQIDLGLAWVHFPKIIKKIG